MNKVICIGKAKAFYFGEQSARVFCRIKFENGKLSITGVHGPMSNGNAKGNIGQINLNEYEFTSFDYGWDQNKVEDFAEIWNKYHLNDMQAGSPNQRKYLENYPDVLDYEDRYHLLQNAGLNPDPDYIHNGKPYKYGSAWLFKEVPDWVIAWLDALPETTEKYAWC